MILAFDLLAIFNSSAANKLKAAGTKVVSWIKRNPLKALGIAVGVIAGAACIFFLAPLVAAGVGAFLSAGLLVQIGVLFSLSVLFTFVITSLQILFNFNWAESDEDLDKEIKAAYNGLYGMTGGLLGKSFGYLVCGALPGAVSFAFNKGVAAAIMENIAEEAQEELLGQLSALANACFRSFATAQLKKQFKSARRYLKKKPNHPLSKILREKMGEKRFREWGEKSGQTFTLSSAIEDRIENIKDPRLRNFTEEFLEEFTEGCTEAGYIVVNTIETTLAAQAMMARRAAGIDPDENVVTATIS
jgi:hypothetical protein